MCFRISVQLMMQINDANIENISKLYRRRSMNDKNQINIQIFQNLLKDI